MFWQLLLFLGLCYRLCFWCLLNSKIALTDQRFSHWHTFLVLGLFKTAKETRMTGLIAWMAAVETRVTTNGTLEAAVKTLITTGESLGSAVNAWAAVNARTAVNAWTAETTDLEVAWRLLARGGFSTLDRGSVRFLIMITSMIAIVAVKTIVAFIMFTWLVMMRSIMRFRSFSF